MLIVIMEKKVKFIISEELKGMRLDKCIPALDNKITRMTAQRLLDEGKIVVNRKSREAII